MSYTMREISRSLYRLVRFIFGYALVIVCAFYLLPHAAVVLQARYESVDTSVRIGLLAVACVLIVAALSKAFRLRNAIETSHRRNQQHHS
jgi:uncharacterized membrane protein YfhO